MICVCLSINSQHVKQIGTACREKYKQVPSLVVAILPEGGGDVYAAVKQYVPRFLIGFQ